MLSCIPNYFSSFNYILWDVYQHEIVEWGLILRQFEIRNPAEEILADQKNHRQVPIKCSQHVLDLCPSNKWRINLVHLIREPVGLVCKGTQAVSLRDPTQLIAARSNCSSASLAALVCPKFPISRESGLKVNLEGLQGVCCGSCYCEVTIW